MAGLRTEAKALLDRRGKTFPWESYISYVTAVLGVHVGPGALGIIVQWAD